MLFLQLIKSLQPCERRSAKRDLKRIYFIFERWSVIVPIMCYSLFFILILTMRMPLKGSSRFKYQNDNTFVRNVNFENTFQIKIRNSNFNSDKHEGDILSDKNEYLVNVNDLENIRRDETEILMDVFSKADRDKNNFLDLRELSDWIRMKIVEHITAAVSSNYELFVSIDVNPKNGVVTWKEYHSYFLKKRGFNSKYVEKHDEKRHKGLKRAIKEQIMRDKASWMEAAKSNPEALTADEFLAFMHPESSASNQLALVDELYDKFDRDGDELLTEEEFAIFQTEGGDDETILVRQNENERRAEFRALIDLNGDGKADRRELLHYVAPQSPRHSEHEAEALLAISDNDHDNMLSLEEILAHPNLFLKSKMVDTAKSFHDEF